ncbi:hypothetical protein C5167_046788 [Papaver somniferum]|uniref:Uncharacterized protein n=1 Tax=Papaver somniferum TaxID=3469 RepID=A0A4Y7LH18_PAPSO|nr:hypothetical protein C5167_046788 [Papaver somniferum]
MCSVIFLKVDDMRQEFGTNQREQHLVTGTNEMRRKSCSDGDKYVMIPRDISGGWQVEWESLKRPRPFEQETSTATNDLNQRFCREKRLTKKKSTSNILTGVILMIVSGI